MDQRRADAVMDLFRRVADGNDLPWMRARREREVGIVLHADTFFGDGPGKDAPGELRGLGAPAPIDPHSAAAAGPRPRSTPAPPPASCSSTRPAPCSAPCACRTHRRAAGPATCSSARSAPPSRTYPTCRPSPTNRRWRSPTTSEPSTRAAPPMTAPGSRPAATSTTTSPGPADPPASPTCVHAAGATTSSRPEASYEHACTPTDPSPPPPCSAPPSPPDPNPCPATAPARPTPPCTQPDARRRRRRHCQPDGCALTAHARSATPRTVACHASSGDMSSPAARARLAMDRDRHPARAVSPRGAGAGLARAPPAG